MSIVLFQSLAWGSVDGATGNLLFGRGATSTRVAVGRYEIELSPDFELDNNEMMPVLVVRDPTSVVIAIDTVLSTNIVKEVKCRNGTTGALIDCSFYFEFKRLQVV